MELSDSKCAVNKFQFFGGEVNENERSMSENVFHSK